jgi:predicted component of type VI protein secretion system
MALVTLRDLTTNEDIDVPPEGYIFGRAGGDADIQLEDNSISRRQARVSLKGGMWLLETLAVPQGQRPPRPVQLEEGATFAVGQSEFEVVRVEAEDEPEPDPGAKTIAPQKGKPAPAPATPAKKAPAPSSAKPTTSPPRKTTTVAADEAASDEAPAKGFGAMFVAVPRGVAYYLLNVPKAIVGDQ